MLTQWNSEAQRSEVARSPSISGISRDEPRDDARRAKLQRQSPATDFNRCSPSLHLSFLDSLTRVNAGYDQFSDFELLFSIIDSIPPSPGETRAFFASRDRFPDESIKLYRPALLKSVTIKAVLRRSRGRNYGSTMSARRHRTRISNLRSTPLFPH